MQASMPQQVSLPAPSVRASADATPAPVTKVASARVDWVDLAKGLTITLVVLLHAVGMLVRKDLTPEFWRDINAFLQPIRMPLFFAASGLFAQGMIAMTWQRMLRSRVAHLFYLYMVWLLVFFAVHNVLPAEVRHGGYAKFEAVIRGTYLPSSALWFIYGLAVFAIVAKLISRLPVSVQFGLAVALSVAAYGRYGFFADLGFGWRNMAMYFVYFLLALHVKELVIAFSRLSNGWRVLAAVGAYLAVYLPIVKFSVFEMRELRLLVTTVGLGLGVLVAAWLAGTFAGRAFQSVGTRTLPVYVMMDILIAIVVYVLLQVPAFTALPGVGAVLPIAVTVAVVLLALSAHRVLTAARMDFLFELHPRVRGVQSAKKPARA
ncbi:acyltransferase family protein [Hoyosella sp. YIM 151337]|uniref:acyltransferase family protein n=1 Tax=Hoyosella sp. YIM 151337 TaxID=2992742 RepID=UPI002236729F|nr:acyltransferase family protein [Hoyosella sp. YIM 151337]MCW4353796.1 acyltransferase family protein [Hoyosella sp. YIM 151337]